MNDKVLGYIDCPFCGENVPHMAIETREPASFATVSCPECEARIELPTGTLVAIITTLQARPTVADVEAAFKEGYEEAWRRSAAPLCGEATVPQVPRNAAWLISATKAKLTPSTPSGGHGANLYGVAKNQKAATLAGQKGETK